MNPKISEEQHSKPADIYVRQSTLAQVRHHQESTERQYALRQKATELGWSESSIRILDRDLGISGAHTTGRTDFKTLVADVSMGQVGAVFALEASRPARSNADWHRLLELCALTRTLVIDEDGCYDPEDFNDGLLLGLKGTMAQRSCTFYARASWAVNSTKRRKGNCGFPYPLDSVTTKMVISFLTPTKKCAAPYPWRRDDSEWRLESARCAAKLPDRRDRGDSHPETPIAENQLQQWRVHQLRWQFSKRVCGLAILLDWLAEIERSLPDYCAS
jgi:hypothetical protein